MSILPNQFSPKERKVYLLLFLVLWIYVWIRAVFSPVVNDEAATFYAYVLSGNFLPPHAFWDANNHLLNSFLTIISYKFFGSSLLALRLPNVLISLLYFFYVYKLAGQLKNRLNRWALVLGLLPVHFVIEFFAYDRGYGMSMAFLLAAVFHLWRFFKIQQLADALLMTLFMIFAVTANLTLINSYILLHLMLGLFLLSNIRRVKLKKIFPVFAMQILLALPVLLAMAKYGTELKKRGALYYGSGESFWGVTVHSLAKVLFRPWPEILQYVFALAFVLALAMLLLWSFRYRRQNDFNWGNWIFPFLLGGNIMITLILSLYMGVNFPEDRVGMYFFIFYMTSMAFIADYEIYRSKLFRILLFLGIPLILTQFFLSVGILFSSYFPEYRIPYEFYETIAQDAAKKNFPPTVEGYQMHRADWSFHNWKTGSRLNQLSYSAFPSNTSEYVIATDELYPRWEKDYIEISFDKPSGMHLLKRKIDPELSLLAVNDTMDMPIKSADEYLNFLILNIDSLVGKSFYLTMDMRIRAEAIPFDAAMIISVSDSSGITLTSEAFEFQQMRPDWSSPEGYNMKYVLLMPKVPDNAKKGVVYLWNKRKLPFNILHSSVKLYSFAMK